MRVNQQFRVPSTLILTGATTDFPVVVPRAYTTNRYQILTAKAFGRAAGIGAATLGLFTAAGGGGTILVAAVAPVLGGVDVIFPFTLAAGALSSLRTEQTLFWRVVVAGANSCDVELLISEVGP
jgi:hypothetical protein